MVWGRDERRAALHARQAACLEGVEHGMHIALGASHPFGEHRHRLTRGTAQHNLAPPQHEGVRTAEARLQRRALGRRQRPNKTIRFHPKP